MEVPEGKTSGNFANDGDYDPKKEVTSMTVTCGSSKLKMDREGKLTLNGAPYGTAKNGDKIRLTYNGNLLINDKPANKG